MYALAIDTSQSKGQMLLLENEKIIHNSIWHKKSSHSELITAKLMELCNKAKIGICDIRKIHCVCGPGSFTGSRVAVNFAKTLAYSSNGHLVGINGLDLLSLSCSANPPRPILACMDAMKNSIFASFYDSKNKSIFRNQWMNVQDLDSFIKEQTYLCGQGLDRYKNLISEPTLKFLKQEPQWLAADLKNYFKKPFFRKKEKEIPWTQLQPLYIKDLAIKKV